MRVYSQSFFLVRDPTSVRLSRRRLHDLAENWGLRLNEASDTALTTVLSELVTNAVRHGTGAMLTIGVRANLSLAAGSWSRSTTARASFPRRAARLRRTRPDAVWRSSTVCPSATEPNEPPAASAYGQRSPSPNSGSRAASSFFAPVAPPEPSPAA